MRSAGKNLTYRSIQRSHREAGASGRRARPRHSRSPARSRTRFFRAKHAPQSGGGRGARKTAERGQRGKAGGTNKPRESAAGADKTKNKAKPHVRIMRIMRHERRRRVPAVRRGMSYNCLIIRHAVSLCCLITIYTAKPAHEVASAGRSPRRAGECARRAVGYDYALHSKAAREVARPARSAVAGGRTRRRAVGYASLVHGSSRRPRGRAAGR